MSSSIQPFLFDEEMVSDDDAPIRVAMRVRRWWQLVGRLPLMHPIGPRGLYFMGEGPDDFECGNCAATLATRMFREELVEDALRCPQCRSWNVI